MPEIGPEAYMINLWQDAGTVLSTGYGLSRLTWQEIESWINVRKLRGEVPLTPYEIETVRRLSEEYAGEYGAASAKGHPPPYIIDGEDGFDRGAMANKIANVLMGFKIVKEEPERSIEEYREP